MENNMAGERFIDMDEIVTPAVLPHVTPFKQTSSDWDKLQFCMEEIDEMTDAHATFTQELFDNIDRHKPFIESRSEKTVEYFYCVHDMYVNGNEDAFEDFEE